MNNIRLIQQIGILLFLSNTVTAGNDINYQQNEKLRKLYDQSRYISHKAEFFSLVPGNTAIGKGFFGLSPDNRIDSSFGGIFEGSSVIYGKVVSNGTMCSHCHRPESNLLLPPPPLSSHIPAGDPVLTGRNAEAQGDPRQADLFEFHGLIKQRASRFNVLLLQTDPHKKAFSWRKTQTIWNMAFNQGLLTDGRARGPVEQARGAVFTHTQDTDVRFDDIVNPRLNDMAAWQQTIVTPPELKDLLAPNAPLHDVLLNDPFYTVHLSTQDESEGQKVFEENCMSCHNMPNVFNNIEHIPGPPVNFPPLYGKTYNIGVSKRNRWNLDFRYFDVEAKNYSPITITLTREDGKAVNHTIQSDLGAALATGRLEDFERFKVPQLRRIKDLAPYFHDNSALTLEEVVQYFNSEDYNKSPDGKNHPIHLNAVEITQLISFLRRL